MTAPALPFSAAAERNRGPILQVLRRVLPVPARVLEIASGSGQHAAHFAAAEPRWSWQPTELDGGALAAITARCAALPNVAPPLALDVRAKTWPAPIGSVDAVYCANMLHIAPWPTCAALMAGAARHLAPGGRLVLYGPYLIDGEAAARSNVEFDADLRARDPAWGLRLLSEVVFQACERALVLQERIAMPANNQILWFEFRT